jgi:hypothetical protein
MGSGPRLSTAAIVPLLLAALYPYETKEAIIEINET